VHGRFAALLFILVAGCLDKPAAWSPASGDTETSAADRREGSDIGDAVGPPDDMPVSDVHAEQPGRHDIYGSDNREISGPEASAEADVADLAGALDSRDGSGFDAATWTDSEAFASPDLDAGGDGDCVPSCAQKECGADGCGGICATCPLGYDCLDKGNVANCLPNCEALCTGKECGFGTPTTQCPCGMAQGECEDGNTCTEDVCSLAKKCVFEPNAEACDDGNVCTVDD
jgi:hypothetical protein